MGRLRPLKYKLNTKQPCKVKIFEKYAVVRAKLFLTTYSSVGGRWFQGNSKGEKNTTNKFQTLMALTLSSTFNSNFPHGSICPALRESTSQTLVLVYASRSSRVCPREGSTATGNARPLSARAAPGARSREKRLCSFSHRHTPCNFSGLWGPWNTNIKTQPKYLKLPMWVVFLHATPCNTPAQLFSIFTAVLECTSELTFPEHIHTSPCQQTYLELTKQLLYHLSGSHLAVDSYFGFRSKSWSENWCLGTRTVTPRREH